MKRLSLRFIFLLSGPLLVGQSEPAPGTPRINSDRAAVQKWLTRAQQSQFSQFTNGSLRDDDMIVSQELDGTEFCAYMRTYRVKRESRGSDATRPAGYTTCVPAARFTIKSAVGETPE